MTIAEMLLQDFDIEISNTRRTLERVPETPDWAPHEKSMKIGKLAMHCATMPLFGLYIMEDDGMNLADPNPKRKHADLTFTSRAACLARLADSAPLCRAAIEAASDEHLSELWPFAFGEQIISNVNRVATYRTMCINHLTHHTAQLGVYLRLNGIAVPALYGPSADEQWSPK
jgi:uncharacterized damage-inducible protein DinB